jgi:hypothetical protein
MVIQKVNSLRRWRKSVCLTTVISQQGICQSLLGPSFKRRVPPASQRSGFSVHGICPENLTSTVDMENETLV